MGSCPPTREEGCNMRLLKRSGLACCATGIALVSSSIGVQAGFTLFRASGPTPFSPGCNGAPQTGNNYPNAEVEPYVSVNPRNGDHIVGVWQQDRWSNGGSNGLMTGVSRDGGRSWTRTFAHFSRCAGGNQANGGDYERASDPWVSFARNGTVHQINLSFDDTDGNQAVLASRSLNGGDTWSEPVTLQRDTSLDVALDKEAITADPHDSRFVYAVWDRLSGLNCTNPNDAFGPTFFSRSTDGGKSWEPARIAFDPGPNAQTIGNEIVVAPNGDLFNMFTYIPVHAANCDPNPAPLFVAVIRSTDRGATWSKPVVVNSLGTIGIRDPKTHEPVRTGDIIPQMSVDRETGVLYVVWQDARFSGGQRDGIAFSRSADSGQTWSAPTQVNKATNVQAFTASINVTEDGTIGVTFYDFRNDTADPAVLLTTTWLALSRDGGQSWHEKRVATPFDMRTAPVARGFFTGDYEGLGVDENTLF